jgi:Tol biopolymer transport system component
MGAGVAFVGSRVLTSTRSDDGQMSTAVIPQGGAALIAFGTLDDGPDGQKAGDIYTVRADGSELRQLTDGPEWEADPAWSPDGTRIAFRSWDAGTDSVVVMDADGTNRLTLASSPQPSQECLKGASLAWAPDGSSLIFPTRSSCSGRRYDLKIVAADGTTEATPLLTESFDGRFATWSPDGTAIAFIGMQDQPTAALYITYTNPARALEGPTRGRRIGPDLGSDDLSLMTAPPRWSPDGSAVAVASAWQLPGSGSTAAHVVTVDGTAPDLTIDAATNPAWSPDGSQIAFQRTVDPAGSFNDRPCTVRTWLVEADGSNERAAEELGDGCDFGPAWSPDGTRLLGLWIDTDPANADEAPFYLSIVTVDGSAPPVHTLDTAGASWQPVVPPSAPDFVAASSPSP